MEQASEPAGVERRRSGVYSELMCLSDPRGLRLGPLAQRPIATSRLTTKLSCGRGDHARRCLVVSYATVVAHCDKPATAVPS